MNRKIAIFTIVAMLFSFVGQFAVAPVEAAGITMYADLTPDSNYNGVSSAGLLDDVTIITTEAEVDVSTSTDIYFGFITDSGYEFTTSSPTTTLTFTFPDGWITAGCTTGTTDADSDGVAEGSFDHSGATTSTYSFGLPTSQAGTKGVEFCINITTPSTSANQVAVFVSDNAVDPQTSAVLIYVGNANDVYVTAEVQQSIYFVIMDIADVSTTNACDLGILSAGEVNTCSYRLAIETAADNGYTAYIKDTSLYPGLTANAGVNDIDAVTEDTTVLAGNEAYGIALTVATTTATTSTDPFDDNDTPIPTDKTAVVTATDVVNYVQGDYGSSSLITHRASINANTQSGDYTQTVSYYVTANF